ncbi:hypothetical protein ECEC1868_0442, partial [Escherichia coli EC1868]
GKTGCGDRGKSDTGHGLFCQW